MQDGLGTEMPLVEVALRHDIPLVLTCHSSRYPHNVKTRARKIWKTLKTKDLEKSHKNRVTAI